MAADHGRCQPGRGQLPHGKARPRRSSPELGEAKRFRGQRVQPGEAAEAVAAEIAELRREDSTPPAARAE